MKHVSGYNTCMCLKLIARVLRVVYAQLQASRTHSHSLSRTHTHTYTHTHTHRKKIGRVFT